VVASYQRLPNRILSMSALAKALVFIVLFLGGDAVADHAIQSLKLGSGHLLSILIWSLSLTPCALWVGYWHDRRTLAFVPLVLWLTLFFAWGLRCIVRRLGFGDPTVVGAEGNQLAAIFVYSVCFACALICVSRGWPRLLVNRGGESRKRC